MKILLLVLCTIISIPSFAQVLNYQCVKSISLGSAYVKYDIEELQRKLEGKGEIEVISDNNICWRMGQLDMKYGRLTDMVYDCESPVHLPYLELLGHICSSDKVDRKLVLDKIKEFKSIYMRSYDKLDEIYSFEKVEDGKKKCESQEDSLQRNIKENIVNDKEMGKILNKASNQ